MPTNRHPVLPVDAAPLRVAASFRTAPPWLATATSLAITAVLLAACGGGAGTAPTPSAVASATAAAASSTVTLTDAWVKAATGGMTSMFGTFVNPTASDVTVVAATSPVGSTVELHEVVTTGGTTRMQPKAGGFVVPAHGRLELRPGGNHLMVMGLKQPIRPGDTVTATLTLRSGGTVTVSAVGKEYAGAGESYGASGAAAPAVGGTMSMSPGSTMSMSASS